MSEKQGTEQKIVEKALEMFNASGVEYVGMRELAEALGMRVGNLTYYFPTKDHLVDRLSRDLSEENNRTVVIEKKVTMTGFFLMLRQVLRNHMKYRCLMISFVHLMVRNPIIAKRYEKVQANRNDVLTANILALKNAGYLRSSDKEEVDFLVATIALIARFWISEAAISYKHLSEQQQVEHYTNICARIFLSYATAKGKKEIEEVLSEPGSSLA